MKAMAITKICSLNEEPDPLQLIEIAVPVPAENELLVRVKACGVCHTELDEIEGRTPPLRLPLVPGHQVVGVVERAGRKVKNFKIGDRVGISWIYSACGQCRFCQTGHENLCKAFAATGRDVNGGYAEYLVVSDDYALAIPSLFQDAEAAPLLCAGAVGYRALGLTNLKDGENLGLVGFGASAHLVIQIARQRFPHSKVFVFARDMTEQEFGRSLGAFWAGGIEEAPVEKMQAVIDTTPVWQPVVEALRHLDKGGRLVINAIRKEEVDKPALLTLDYALHLWLEKEIKSVANVTRRDVREFLELAAEIPIRPAVQLYDLKQANQALLELKQREIRGAKVLKMD